MTVDLSTEDEIVKRVSLAANYAPFASADAAKMALAMVNIWSVSTMVDAMKNDHVAPIDIFLPDAAYQDVVATLRQLGSTLERAAKLSLPREPIGSDLASKIRADLAASVRVSSDGFTDSMRTLSKAFTEAPANRMRKVVADLEPGPLLSPEALARLPGAQSDDRTDL